MNYRARLSSLGSALICGGVCLLGLEVRGACFTNSIMPGQDPTVTLKDGIYHLVQSDGCNIHLRRATTIGGLATAADSIIYAPGCSEVWAPELHWLNNRWYLYISRNPGGGHRGYVAESQGSSPYGPYTDRGILFNSFWNIDGSVFTATNGQLYYICSGNEGTTQNLYLAPMSNPYTLSAPLALLSEPMEAWERIGDPKVNEGPWAFQRNGKLCIVYSASGCWTDDYTLGLLTFTGTNPLIRSHWTKSGPVFSKQPGAYGPGHNCTLQDAAGQWWNIYHANNNPGEGCGGLRRIRAQRFDWSAGNVPNFGTPVPIGSAITEDADFLVARFRLEEVSGTKASSTICGRSGIFGGAPVWTNPGLKFNGVSDFLDCGAALGNDVQHAVTLAAWIRADAFSDWAGIVSKGTNTAPYALQTWSDGAVRFTANWGGPAGGVGGGSWNSNTKLSGATWYHVAVTYDGTLVRFYINGVLDANQPAATLRFGVVNEPLYLGADFPGGDEFLNGTIRDARLYGRALSGMEVAVLANRPPSLSAIPNAVIGAGQTLTFTNTATDPDAGQTLTFSMPTAPVGAVLNSTNGVFAWRPAVAQADSTNATIIWVTDSGVPGLSAVQSFNITVTNLTKPLLGLPTLANDLFQMRIEGDYGPDYVIQVSTNLGQSNNWVTLLRTNPPALPFFWTDPAPVNAVMQFYRVSCE